MLTHLLTLLSVLALGVHAQFQFFDNFFGQQGGGGGGHGGHHNHQQAPSRGSDWYGDQVRDSQCEGANYLCPGTLDCVERPVECPCPLDLVRCVVGEHRVCVARSEAEGGCGLVDKYAKVSFLRSSQSLVLERESTCGVLTRLRGQCCRYGYMRRCMPDVYPSPSVRAMNGHEGHEFLSLHNLPIGNKHTPCGWPMHGNG